MKYFLARIFRLPVVSCDASGAGGSSEEGADLAGTGVTVSNPAELASCETSSGACLVSEGFSSSSSEVEVLSVCDGTECRERRGSGQEIEQIISSIFCVIKCDTWRQKSIPVIPVWVSVGAWSRDMSVSVTDETLSVMTATLGSLVKGADSADSSSGSGVAELGAELSVVKLNSSTTADSGFGTAAD